MTSDSTGAKTIKDLVRALKSARLSVYYMDVRDALWLSRFLPAPDQLEAEERPKPVEPKPDERLTKAEEKEKDKAEPSARRIVINDAEDDRPVYAPQPGAGGPLIQASTVRAPGVLALPKSLEVARSLRPFLRRFPSRQRSVIDEEATVQRIAEVGSLNPNQVKPLYMAPVFTPQKERWFEAAVVIEKTPSIAIWHQIIKDFIRLLGQHGAFSDVRRWSFQATADNVELLGTSGAKRKIKELSHPTGRRLIFVVSDCVSNGWRNGVIEGALSEWGASTPVVLVQLLAERLWGRTALGIPSVKARAIVPGVPNKHMEIEKEWWDTDPVGRRVALPVITLEPGSVKQWANMTMGFGTSAPAVLIPIERDEQDQGSARGETPELSAEQRIQRFRALVSPQAFQLATYFTAIPLSFPVMRLLQETMLPETGQVHIAEVLLGGIAKPVAPGGEVSAEKVSYEFHEGVREALGRLAPRSDLMRVLHCLSRFVEQRAGQSLDFEVLAADPSGLSRVPEEAIPIARVGAETFKRMGGSRLPFSVRKQQPADRSEPGPRQEIEEEVYAPGLTIRRSYQSPVRITQVSYAPAGGMLALHHPYRISVVSTDKGKELYSLDVTTPAGTARPRAPSVYVSYARADDERDFIFRLVEALSEEVRNRRGGDVSIFVDKEITPAGISWTEQILEEISRASVLITIITPAYFRSDVCRTEMREFIARESERGHKPLIIPIYLMDALELHSPSSNLIAREIVKRAHSDWRELRHLHADSIKVQKEINRLASSINAHLSKREKAPPPAVGEGDQTWWSSIAWSPDSAMLAVAQNHTPGRNSTLMLIDSVNWQAESKPLVNLPGSVERLDWQPGKQEIMMALSDGSLQSFNNEWNNIVEVLPPQPQAESSGKIAPAIKWSPDGKVLAVLHKHGLVEFITEGVSSIFHNYPDILPVADSLMHLAWLEDLLLVTCGNASAGIEVFDSKEKRLVVRLDTGGEAVTSLSVSKVAGLVAAALESGILRMWRTDTWELVSSTARTDTAGSNKTLAFSPARAELAVAEDSLLQLLRVHGDVIERRKREDWALIVGISRYPGFTDLDRAEDNARAFYKWVISPEGGNVPPDQCRLLLSSDSWTLADPLGARPSNVDIERAISIMITGPGGGETTSPAGRRLYIYLTGLGVRTSERETALLMANANSQLLSTNVPGKSYADWFLESGGFDEVILFMDYQVLSNERVLSGGVPFAGPRRRAKDSKYFFAFSNRWGPAVDSQVKTTFFTDALLKGLSGEAADSDGSVTVAGLTNFLRRKSLELGGENLSPAFEISHPDLVLSHIESADIDVQIHFDSIYLGKRARVVDSNSVYVAEIESIEGIWKSKLKRGSYSVEIPSLGIRNTFTVARGPTTVSVSWRFKNRWVLVAGTGAQQLFESDYQASEAVGIALAEAGYGLIGGGWTGVDETVARAFNRRIALVSQSAEGFFIQIVRESETPAFAGGQVIRVPAGSMEFTESVRRAEAVVLIGGYQGTYEMYNYARRANLPVFPLNTTGYASKRAYNDLIKSRREADWLRSIDIPISGSKDAQLIAERIISTLETRIIEKPSAEPAAATQEDSSGVTGPGEASETVERDSKSRTVESGPIRLGPSGRHPVQVNMRFDAGAFFLNRLRSGTLDQVEIEVGSFQSHYEIETVQIFVDGSPVQFGSRIPGHGMVRVIHTDSTGIVVNNLTVAENFEDYLLRLSDLYPSGAPEVDRSRFDYIMVLTSGHFRPSSIRPVIFREISLATMQDTGQRKTTRNVCKSVEVMYELDEQNVLEIRQDDGQVLFSTNTLSPRTRRVDIELAADSTTTGKFFRHITAYGNSSFWIPANGDPLPFGIP